MTYNNQPYSSPELERPAENPDQKQEDELTRGLESVKNNSQNPYEGGEPIHPEDLQTNRSTEQVNQPPENDQESQIGDREVLRNQKEILEDARRTLGELETVSSENNSTARAAELNSWLATALNEAEKSRQNPPVDQDHRLVADRLHVIDELTTQSKELVSTYKNYESKFKRASETFKADCKEAMKDFERAIENHDADELAKQSVIALDRLKSDQGASNSIMAGFNAEVIVIYSKMDSLSSRYYAPTERLAENQLGQNQDLDVEKAKENISAQQESSNMMHGINEFRGRSTEQISQLSVEMARTLVKQQDIIKQIEEIKFGARRNEIDGHDESQRRSKADRLGGGVIA